MDVVLAKTLRSRVTVRVQNEDLNLHPDLEFWTYTHC